MIETDLGERMTDRIFIAYGWLLTSLKNMAIIR